MPHPSWLEQARPSSGDPRAVVTSGGSSDAAEKRLVGANIYSAIVDAAIDPIIAIDSRGRIIQWNPAAERAFGYTRTQALGHSMMELIIPPRLREAHLRGFNRPGAGDQPGVLGRIETHAMRSDGTEFPVSLAISRLDCGDEAAFAAYFRDLGMK
jgi:PAS domain S-box-containing protein